MPFGIQAFESDKTAANVAEFAKVMMGSFFQAEASYEKKCGVHSFKVLFFGGSGEDLI